MFALLYSLFATTPQLGGRAVPEPPPWYTAWYGVLLLLALSFAVSILLSTVISRALRMKDLAWKIWLVFFVIFLSFVGLVAKWPPKRGIDLAGGTNLVYEIDQSKRDKNAPAVNMSSLIEAISRRVDPAGVKQVLLRQHGENEIEAVIPETDPVEVEQIKKDLVATGHLEFRILAHQTKDHDILPRARAVNVKLDEPTVDARRDNPVQDKLIKEAVESNNAVLIVGDRERARWENVKPADAEKVNKDPLLVTRMHDGQLQKLVIVGQPIARWVPVGEDENGRVRLSELNHQSAVFRKRDDRKPGALDVLVMIDKQDVEGKYLDRSAPEIGTEGPCVAFSFKPEGSKRFGVLTGDNLPTQDIVRQLAIVLDDEVLSAPNIKSVISDRGQISGGFTQKEVNWLVNVLNAGNLPASLAKEPIMQSYTPATLGDATIAQGLLSIKIALLVVPLFMIAYYRFAGFVAASVLLLNVLIVVAVMVLLQAPFTLSGMAGLVLTVGMAVDANVLIYERMREELDRGAAMRMAIRNGYSRAMRTIVDANMSNLITGVVLYSFGTDQIKGFAVTLILGIMTSMFTAIFCSRLVFDILERKRWLTNLKMTRILQKTNIDFIGGMKWCLAGSATIIILGAVAAIQRGADFYDIDFRGGYKVQVLFLDPQNRDEVDNALVAYSKKQPTESQLDALVVTRAGTEDKAFDIETTQTDPKKVTRALTDTFPGKLQANHVKFDPAQLKTVVAAKLPDAGLPKPDDGSQTKEKTSAEKKAEDKKPVEQKADDKAPVDKSAEKKAPEVKPAGESPSKDEPKKEEPKKDDIKKDEKAPDKKSADAKTPAKPGDGASLLRDGLRMDGAENLLALADDAQYALALADPKAPASDADKAAAKFADDKKADAKDAGAKDTSKPDPKNAAADTATKPVDAKKADEAKAAESKDAATKDAEAKDTEAKNTEAKNAEKKPAEAAPPAAADKMPAAVDGAVKAAAQDAAAAAGAAGDTLIDLPESSFIGGTAVPLKLEQPMSQDQLSAKIAEAKKKSGVEVEFNVSNPKVAEESRLPESEWLLKIKANKADTSKLLATLEGILAGEPSFPIVVNVHGQVAGAARNQAILATTVCILLIAAYIWLRFQQIRYGLAAVIALVHDVFVSLALLAITGYLAKIPFLHDYLLLEPFKLNMIIVAAVMTLVGYSLNDTVVIFDRIRELRGKSPLVTRGIINASVNQTLSRTLLTSFLTFMVVVILYFVGGPNIHGFAFTLVIGIIVGTYSSIYIASPVLLWMERSQVSNSPQAMRAAQRRKAGIAD